MRRFYIEVFIIIFVALTLAACTAYTVVNIITDNRDATINKEQQKTGVKIKIEPKIKVPGTSEK